MIPPLTTPVFQILLSLVDRELHGYAIIQDIAERTDGELRLTASTLYAAVKRLLDAGLNKSLYEAPVPANLTNELPPANNPQPMSIAEHTTHHLNTSKS